MTVECFAAQDFYQHLNKHGWVLSGTHSIPQFSDAIVFKKNGVALPIQSKRIYLPGQVERICKGIGIEMMPNSLLKHKREDY